MRRPRTRASRHANIQPVQIDGFGAEPGVIGNSPGKYHFWTVEYLYRYGSPPANSLVATFLTYMNSYAVRDILRGRGYIPRTTAQTTMNHDNRTANGARRVGPVSAASLMTVPRLQKSA